MDNISEQQFLINISARTREIISIALRLKELHPDSILVQSLLDTIGQQSSDVISFVESCLNQEEETLDDKLGAFIRGGQ